MIFDRTRQIRYHLRYIFWICFYWWTAALLANAAGRLALANHQFSFVPERIDYIVSGLAMDCVQWLGIFFALNILISIIFYGIVRHRSSGYYAVFRSTLIPTTTVLFLVILVGTIWASEHMIERSAYPTMLELSNAVSVDFALAGAQVFTLERFRYTTLVSLAIFAIASVLMYRLVWRYRLTSTLLVTCSSIGTLIAVSASFYVYTCTAASAMASLDSSIVDTPLRAFVAYGVTDKASGDGSLQLFRKLRLSDDLLVPGAELLGLNPASANQLENSLLAGLRKCHTHPLATPFDPPVHNASPTYDQELVQQIRTLSNSLFTGRKGPLYIWLVMLESLRGDDVHALHSNAPRDITPYINTLYEQSKRAGSGIITAKYVLQGGIRTIWGLSAVTCGLGTMPYTISISRDLGTLPLRCLPDILKDGGFRISYYYGSDPTFDKMLEYLSYHGLDHSVTDEQFRKEASFRGWGILDHAVFMQALDDASRAPNDLSQFNLVMSLTNHFPFADPTDLPPDARQRVAKAIEGRKVTKDDHSRLKTTAYTDWVFEKFVSRIRNSARAPSSIIIAVGDHSTTDTFLWRENQTHRDLRYALTRIPLTIIFPQAFLANSPDRAAANQAIANINAHLSQQAISQNDIALFILKLLMQTEAISQIRDPWRWHTMGAQRLSPYFHVHKHPNTAIIGVDGNSKVYFASSNGYITNLNEKTSPTQNVRAAMMINPTLHPVVALLSAMVRGYAESCGEAQYIRHKHKNQP